MRCAIVALFGVVLSGSLASAQSLEGRLKTVHETATLRIAYRTDSRPFSFLDSQRQPTGYTIELCRAHRQVGSSASCACRRSRSNGCRSTPKRAFEVIVDGSADMECGSTTVSLSRMKIVDFSSLIYAESTGVLVKVRHRNSSASTTWRAGKSA